MKKEKKTENRRQNKPKFKYTKNRGKKTRCIKRNEMKIAAVQEQNK